MIMRRGEIVRTCREDELEEELVKEIKKVEDTRNKIQ
jgi:hypothetical protein